ncbi:alpha-tubulin N-acetyltransferase 1-like [Oscarella lobularis]|uniref:alpha-tubulin N-acetyltransferase 1-like n=1 Tax=Oscarella lobularis TaxID=121494 RepID=UPI00331333F5
MEFPFPLTPDLFPDEITVLCRPTDRSSVNSKRLASVIDTMGRLSASAQGLRVPITTTDKWIAFPDQKIYVVKDSSANGGNGCVIGMLKTGKKKLFLADFRGKFHEVEPLCLLDFYVHESRQRGGQGKRIFEHMLRSEGLKAHQVVIDKPSFKCLAFFRRHYNLTSYVKQANNFVAFDQFFSSNAASSSSSTHVQKQQRSLGSFGFGSNLPAVPVAGSRFGTWSGQSKSSWTIGIVPGLSLSQTTSNSQFGHGRGYLCDSGTSFRLNSYSRYS